MITKAVGVFWKVIPAYLRRWLTRRLHPTFTVSAAGVIVNERREVLLLNHVLRSASGWGIPGGFIGIGEQPEAALRREIKEETGLELEDVRLIRCRTLYRHIEVIMIAKGVGDAKVLSREITELGWFAIDSMPAEMSADHKTLVRSIVESGS